MVTVRLSEPDWIALCNAYFAKLQASFPGLVPSDFPLLRYAPVGRQFIACPSGYAYPKWLCAVVPTYAKQDQLAVAAAFALPKAQRSRFPEPELAKRFRQSGITGDYPGKENGFDFRLMPGGFRFGVSVMLSADIRDRSAWQHYHRWQADMIVRMKPIVDEI